MKIPQQAGNHYARPVKPAVVPREPLRTTAECAETYGVPLKTFCGLLNSPGAPAPVFRTRSAKPVNYYRASEIKRWWATLDRNK